MVSFWLEAFFSGYNSEKATGKIPGLFYLILFFFRPSVFRAWRTIPISMFPASGSEEWLPKLLLSFLVFGKRRALLNWLWAVMMWGLTGGRKSWKYSPAFWFKRAQCVGLCWGCFGCSEQVLGGGVQKWPWGASTVGSVCACCCAFAPHFSSDCVGQVGPQILHLVTFIMSEFPLVFNITAFSIFIVSENRCCWCSLHLWLWSQACPDSNILLTCTPRVFSGIMCPCHCTWAEAAGGKGDLTWNIHMWQ